MTVLADQSSSGIVHTVGVWLSPGGIAAAFLSAAHMAPVVAGTFAGFAAGCFYIFEMINKPPVQEFLKRRRARKIARRIQRLQIKQALIIGELKQMGVVSHIETSVSKVGSEVTQIELEHPALRSTQPD